MAVANPFPSTAQRRALLALAVAGFAAGLVYLAVVLTSEDVDDRGFAAALGLLVGWSFIGTGLFAWWRRPGNRTGELMAAVGFAWFAAGLSDANDDLLHTVGLALDALFPAFAGHLVRFVAADGHPLTLTDGRWTEVELQGRRIAAIVHDPTLADEPELVRAAGAAAALALENQRLSAELRARIEELRSSRAPRRGRRRRAPAPRARPARWRPVPARGARGQAAADAHEGTGPARGLGTPRRVHRRVAGEPRRAARTRTGGSGLRGLADRVAALGGSLELRSPVGAGTEVRAEIPL